MNNQNRMIRLLEADEIECRVGTIGKNGLSLLLYKDARVDQKILDECFSPCGWRRSHQEIGGKLYCTVEVWDKEKQQCNQSKSFKSILETCNAPYVC